ncbi:hypothetical protein ACFUTQ_25895 [Streptomyces sp. NPDC057293]|uniref:hypothetical protein n=1 Tax=Streptomyces sp. NPDC057293 TaxID=3346088 RepID=UPI00363B1415
MIACPSPKCSSPNVADLPHYWRSLPSDSPLKVEYAPPSKPKVSYWAALAAIAVGIVVITEGAILLGLLLVLGGAGWGGLVFKASQWAEAQHAAWSRSHVCLACTGRF